MRLIHLKFVAEVAIGAMPVIIADKSSRRPSDSRFPTAAATSLRPER
jgi:hypothetical protein